MRTWQCQHTYLPVLELFTARALISSPAILTASFSSSRSFTESPARDFIFLPSSPRTSPNGTWVRVTPVQTQYTEFKKTQVIFIDFWNGNMSTCRSSSNRCYLRVEELFRPVGRRGRPFRSAEPDLIYTYTHTCIHTYIHTYVHIQYGVLYIHLIVKKYQLVTLY